MKPNLLKDKLSNTAVLEKETVDNLKQEQVVNSHQQKQAEVLKQNVKKQSAIKPEKETKSAFNKTFFSSETLKNKSILFEEKVVENDDLQQETFFQEPEQESSMEEFVAFKPKPKPQKRAWKMRFKILTAVYVVVIALTGGWVTANAIRIANTTNSIHASDIQYAQKIKELEKLKEQQEEKENNNLISLEDLLEVTPLPLKDVTEYEKQTNWFDNIINWFGNLFGG